MGIQVPPDSTGKIVETYSPDGSTQRQAIVLGDDTAAAARAKVQAADPGASDYGLTVRTVRTPASDYHKVAAATNNAAVIKSAPGKVHGWAIFNNASYPVFVKLYDKATSPNPAADTPLLAIGIQAGIGKDFSLDLGIPFTTGIGIAIVQGIADNDNTPVALADCVVEVFYK